MEKHITREEAFELLKKYNQDRFHIQHALTVEGVMKWFAKELGYQKEEEYWGIVGLLHDIDFEQFPEQQISQISILKKPHNLCLLNFPKNQFSQFLIFQMRD